MSNKRSMLGQFFTPEWVAEALIEQYYPGLGMWDIVCEPSCGDGAFLRSLPKSVPGFGVEIDPEFAKVARDSSGRDVLIGDFCTVELPARPTVLLGNPPFKHALVTKFLLRANDLLKNGEEAGFILPAYFLQTAGSVEEVRQSWSIYQDMLPRNVFPGLSHPLCFARFVRGGGKLFGLALYSEAAAILRLNARYKALLAQGERNVWRAVTRSALEALGGRANLPDIYREIAGVRPTTNKYWKEKVRQQLQRIARRIGPGDWQLQEVAA